MKEREWSLDKQEREKQLEQRAKDYESKLKQKQKDRAQNIRKKQAPRNRAWEKEWKKGQEELDGGQKEQDSKTREQHTEQSRAFQKEYDREVKLRHKEHRFEKQQKEFLRRTKERQKKESGDKNPFSNDALEPQNTLYESSLDESPGDNGQSVNGFPIYDGEWNDSYPQLNHATRPMPPHVDNSWNDNFTQHDDLSQEELPEDNDFIPSDSPKVDEPWTNDHLPCMYPVAAPRDYILYPENYSSPRFPSPSDCSPFDNDAGTAELEDNEQDDELYNQILGHNPLTCNPLEKGDTAYGDNDEAYGRTAPYDDDADYGNTIYTKETQNDSQNYEKYNGPGNLYSAMDQEYPDHHDDEPEINPYYDGDPDIPSPEPNEAGTYPDEEQDESGDYSNSDQEQVPEDSPPPLSRGSINCSPNYESDYKPLARMLFESSDDDGELKVLLEDSDRMANVGMEDAAGTESAVGMIAALGDAVVVEGVALRKGGVVLEAMDVVVVRVIMGVAVVVAEGGKTRKSAVRLCENVDTCNM